MPQYRLTVNFKSASMFVINKIRNKLIKNSYCENSNIEEIENIRFEKK